MSNQTSRTENTVRNIAWGYIGNILSLIIQFVSRTVFIYTIGVSYLGINGLFSSILGMLSLSELGIGTAINYNLYKPVAEGNIEKIKSLMALYKKAYRIIAIIISAIGLALLPFLPYLIKGADEISNISFYYLVFLFNTVSSYFVSYKYGLVNAEQKGYIINSFNSVFTIIITTCQIVVLVLFRSYVFFLVSQSALQLIQKIAIGIYLNKKYPYLCDKDISPLDVEEKKEIKKNVTALIVHKIGEISIYQTDNIIISAFISVTLVGMVSNYNLVISSVTIFITIIFNSVTSSIGNLIAKESKERQKEIFDIYNFLGFWLYGFVCACYFILFQPFIHLWIGGDKAIDMISLSLIILNQYLTGQRLTINNMKTAAGIFEQDKYISLIQGMINLVVSLIMVNCCGLPGVYIGTVVSGLFANITRPVIVYKEIFGSGAKEYFKKSVKYLGTVVFTIVVLRVIAFLVFKQISWVAFIVMMALCAIIPNLLFFVIYHRTKEFDGIKRRLAGLLPAKIRKMG